MKILLDTSLLVAAMVEAHPAHKRALPWLQRIKNKTATGIVSAHSLAELYSILTTLPVQPRLKPSVVCKLIQRNVLDICEIVSLSENDYRAVIERLAKQDIVGGITYDALILYVAVKREVDQVITLNKKDFQRVYPELVDKIISP